MKGKKKTKQQNIDTEIYLKKKIRVKEKSEMKNEIVHRRDENKNDVKHMRYLAYFCSLSSNFKRNFFFCVI